MSRCPLVIFHKQLGDVLLLEPALAKLAAATAKRVTFSTRSTFLPMISLMENVDGVSGLRFTRASEVIAFSNKFHPTLKSLFTSAPIKRLYTNSASNLHILHQLIYNSGIHLKASKNVYKARHFFDLIPCEETFPFRPPTLRNPSVQWLPAELPERYIQVHTTSAWPSKSWPAECWAKTLDILHEKGIGPFVLTGGSAAWEQAFVRSIQTQTAAPILNYSGRTSMEAYLACVANAEMVLSIDGSVAHLAAAFRRKSLTLFGPSNSVSWHYPSDYSAIIDARDFSPENTPPKMKSIPVDAVIKATIRMLSRCASARQA
jgi:ADP-heptose:LPS heptosyltransferase